ncbi:FMN-dependent NADH-azoreductase [Thiomicrorhabdus cannonii]|uniref:FMN-dependent NADH-azoreductase n=1 Tax=Thiomicrorhabdus cannonii TaxID=2748011 RepID=UPI0015BFAA30|nr:NAD(P)H-dependent oxidoreductase [Thiomicrorhabdus cannonii]
MQTTTAPVLVRIDASAQSPAHSISKQLAERFQQHWLKTHHNGEIIHHDLADMTLPYVDESFIEAMYTPKDKRTGEQQQKLALSDALVAELKRADALLISTPMYNFAIPACLKSYIDLVTRAGETFRYGEKGVEGLLSIKQTVVVMASGGDYTQEPASAMNHATPYLKTILGFNGLHETRFINAAGMNMGDAIHAKNLEQAQQQIDALFG